LPVEAFARADAARFPILFDLQPARIGKGFKDSVHRIAARDRAIEIQKDNWLLCGSGLSKTVSFAKPSPPFRLQQLREGHDSKSARLQTFDYYRQSRDGCTAITL